MTDDQNATRRRFVGFVHGWIEDALGLGMTDDAEQESVDDSTTTGSVVDIPEEDAKSVEALLGELGTLPAELSDADLPEGEFLRGGASTAEAPESGDGLESESPQTPDEPPSQPRVPDESSSQSTAFDYRSSEERHEAASTHPDGEFTPGPPDETIVGEESFDPVDGEGDDVVLEGDGVYVLPKDSYCEQCEYLEEPPGIGCRAPDAEILELEDQTHFRVKNCPVVEAERDGSDDE